MSTCYFSLLCCFGNIAWSFREEKKSYGVKYRVWKMCHFCSSSTDDNVENESFKVENKSTLVRWKFKITPNCSLFCNMIQIQISLMFLNTRFCHEGASNNIPMMMLVLMPRGVSSGVFIHIWYIVGKKDMYKAWLKSITIDKLFYFSDTEWATLQMKCHY